jgi:tetratricopeptide (TPR) repeat protein
LPGSGILIATNPENKELYFRRGAPYRFKKNSQKAVDDFTKVLELDPKNENALRQSGLMKIVQLPTLKPVTLKRQKQTLKAPAI